MLVWKAMPSMVVDQRMRQHPALAASRLSVLGIKVQI